MQVGNPFRTRDGDLKQKTRPVTRTLKPNAVDLKPLGPCDSEPLKKLKSICLQMFFKTVSIKSFAIFTGKNLCWGLFLIKLQP